MRESGHTVDTLRDLMDERMGHLKSVIEGNDRRYSENRSCDQDAVKLAKEIADKARGTVSVALLIGVISLILAIVREIK